MFNIPGYQIIQTLYESSRSLIYRGQRQADLTPVVLKLLRPEQPSLGAIDRLSGCYLTVKD